jgi:RNA polymerase sigma-70 factor (ECF subfamily)
LLDDNPESLFKSWLIEHGGVVLKVARAYTLTAEDCQDLVQEILLQVWRSLPRFQGRAGASTWIYRVALNTALDWHRKEHRRRVRQQPIFELEDLPDAGLNGAQQTVRCEAVERLYAAIRQLPKTDAALVLLYLDDLSYRQMAEVLGISESNVG